EGRQRTKFAARAGDSIPGQQVLRLRRPLQGAGQAGVDFPSDRADCLWPQRSLVSRIGERDPRPFCHRTARGDEYRLSWLQPTHVERFRFSSEGKMSAWLAVDSSRGSLPSLNNLFWHLEDKHG